MPHTRERSKSKYCTHIYGFHLDWYNGKKSHEQSVEDTLNLELKGYKAIVNR